jgi:predicted nucleic acid-binding Zn ribbon protein
MPGIVPHRHCVICGKAIESDEVTCSDECQETLEKERKKQRNFMLFMMAGFLVLLILLFIFSPKT